MGALGHLFQVYVKLKFGLLYCGVYGVPVGLKDVTLDPAG